MLTDRNGIPIGWAIDGANRHDSVLLEPTLQATAELGLLAEIETLWLDRGYDSDVTRTRLSALGIDDAVIAKKRKRGVTQGKKSQPMGLRWPVERTNSWLSNFGQLRRNSDRKTIHRLAQFALAVALLLIAKLIDWRNRWSSDLSPIDPLPVCARRKGHFSECREQCLLSLRLAKTLLKGGVLTGLCSPGLTKFW